MAAQNIYDDPAFFAGYAQLRRVEGGLNAAFEWPALKSMLPASLNGMRVLDLGCGMGQFANAARDMDARQVVGVDISERMLTEARSRTTDPAISFVRSDLETFDFGRDTFDLVVSSLALHYIENYRGVARKVATALRPAGRFVFSVEHPIQTCAPALGWHRAPDGAKLHWSLDNYQDEGLRETRWFVDGVIKYHRTVSTYVSGLLEVGLTLIGFAEPEPSKELLALRPKLEEERRRPPFLLLAAEREG